MTSTASSAIALLPLDVPVDPEADEARRWVLEELAKPEYDAARPTWFDRLSTAFWEWLTSLDIGDATGGPDFALILTVVVIVAVLVAAFFFFGAPARNRRAAASGALFGLDDDRSSESLRRDAENAAGDLDWTLAIEERFRAIARALSERTILTATPGTTAHGFAVQSATRFPVYQSQLEAAADSFDRVRYLGKAGTEAEYRQIAALDESLVLARPILGDFAEVAQ